MKRVLSLVILLVSCYVSAQEINWMSMNDALEEQKKEPKKIFADIYTDWCGPCKLMDKRTFTNKKLIEYVNEHFYAVKFDAEGTEEVNYQGFDYKNPNHDASKSDKARNSQHFFAHALKVRAYPTVVFFDENSDVISPVVGYKTAQQLEVFLKMIAEDEYKNVTTKEEWEAYQSNFKATF